MKHCALMMPWDHDLDGGFKNSRDHATLKKGGFSGLQIKTPRAITGAVKGML